MAILNNNPLVGASGNQGGYNINNSLRLRSSASAYLNRTPASAGNRQVWTWSGWVKRSNIGSSGCLFGGGTSGAAYAEIYFSSDNFSFYNNLNSTAQVVTSAVYRDPSAWYHLVVAVDTTQATSSNRVKLYVNGTQITTLSIATYPAQNTNMYINSANIHSAGSLNFTAGNIDFFDGYMADVNFIDGSAKTPSDFGETDTTTGVWKPKAYSGTYGTNGFYLKFSDIATTSGSNAGLGKDFSGNTNYWTTNNISVTAGTTYDAMLDSPTNTSATVANYPTLNPLGGQGGTWSNGNLQYTGPTAWKNTLSTIMLPSTGKFYAEATLLGTGLANNDSYATFGVGTTLGTNPLNNNCSIGDGGDLNNFGTYTTGSGKLSTGDIVSLSIDRDANTFNYRVNNTTRFSGTIGTTAGADLFFNYWSYSGSYGQMAVNFGQRPFAYTPPSGYIALNTFNLPNSTIVKGNKYMDATLYTGTGATQTITNAGSFRPDLVWVKVRSTTGTHVLTDSNRGANKQLFSNLTNAEASATNKITGFTSTGFTLGADDGTGTGDANFNGQTYVGWQWQAGQNSTSSNTSGSITSTVSVNTTAGFSIVTYTGNGTNGASIGHGLGVTPAMVIFKSRGTGGSAYDWPVYHKSLAANNYLVLNSTVASAAASGVFTLSSTLITFTTSYASTNASANTMVAYCWAEIAGFSRFGSYTGNGSADGPFVYTGFRPKFVVIKVSSTTNSWEIFDTSRDTYNASGLRLFAESNSAEVDSRPYIDILSNGFKLRSTGTGINGSGSTYIFMAFAENPFKNSLAR